MTHDLALVHRRAWLHALSRRRHATVCRLLVDRMLGSMVPSRRRARALLRATLVRV